MEKLQKAIEIGFIVVFLLMLMGCVASTKMTPPSWSQKLPAAERFELVLDGAAVLDKETGLVWEKAPENKMYTWIWASYHCYMMQLGGRKGWHLPTIEQLASLVDPSMSKPALPAGHPFNNVQPLYYWSATTTSNVATVAWTVWFLNGRLFQHDKSYEYYTWCVRGGETYDAR